MPPRAARVACLRVADLPLAAELRAHPDLRGRPVVIATAPGPRAEVLSAAPEALRGGARLQGSIVHARAACADLIVRVASPALEHSARETLLDVALSFSPRGASLPRASGAFAAEAAVVLDASGIDRLFQSEAGFATALAERAGRLGLPANVGLASSAEVALLAARAHPVGEVHVLAPHEETAFLAPLPLDLLDPPAVLQERLARFGVHTLGALARLPGAALGTRLGPDVLRWAALARGESEDTPLPEHDVSRFEEAIDLEYPVAQLEGLLFVLRGLLSRLLARLASRHRACADLELSLQLDGGGRDARRVGVAAASTSERVLLRLLRHALESRPPDDAVHAVTLATRGAAPRDDQLDLWRPAGPAPAVLDALVAELESLCGEGRVGTPTPRDSWHPDAFDLHPFTGTKAPAATEAHPTTGPPVHAASATRPGRARSEPQASEVHQDECLRPPPPNPEPLCLRQAAPSGAARSEPQASEVVTLALRALRPPLQAEVRMQSGLPAWLRSAVAQGRVLHCAGPWRTTGGWWSEEERFAFDHYDVHTEDGVVCRLRRNHVCRSWEVDGLYD